MTSTEKGPARRLRFRRAVVGGWDPVYTRDQRVGGVGVVFVRSVPVTLIAVSTLNLSSV
jgi:hypothetical protein